MRIRVAREVAGGAVRALGALLGRAQPLALAVPAGGTRHLVRTRRPRGAVVPLQQADGRALRGAQEGRGIKYVYATVRFMRAETDNRHRQQ